MEGLRTKKDREGERGGGGRVSQHMAISRQNVMFLPPPPLLSSLTFSPLPSLSLVPSPSPPHLSPPALTCFSPTFHVYLQYISAPHLLPLLISSTRNYSPPRPFTPLSPITSREDATRTLADGGGRQITS